MLVRSKDRGESVRAKYPNADNVRVVYPGAAASAMSLTDILEEEARKTDIVLRTLIDSSHDGAIGFKSH